MVLDDNLKNRQFDETIESDWEVSGMTYNILIVDDERIEREGIAFLIRKFGFPIRCREAENGEKALEELDKESCQIMFCDIKMPYMDGIELSAKAKALYPDLKIVFLTAYGEFSFAKQAIEIGALGYLLKPIIPDEFESMMNKVLEECQRDEEKKQEAAAVAAMSLQARQYEKERLLFNLINGLRPSPSSSLQERNEFPVRMLLLSCRSSFFDREKEEWSGPLRQAVDTDYEDLMLNESQCLLFVDDRDGFDFAAVAPRIVQLFEDIFCQTVFMTCSNPIRSQEHYAAEFDKLEQALTYQFFSDRSLILNDGESAASDGEIVESCTQAIKAAFEADDVTKVRYHLDLLFGHLQTKRSYSQFYIKVMLFELVKTGMARLKEAGSSRQLADSIDAAGSLADIRDLLLNVVGDWERGLASEPKYSTQIHHVKRLIEEHYGESIGLEWLASRVYLVPSYLSFLFRKETGTSLNKYITTYRMQKAERLVRETNMKIVEIARSVGYENLSYFCSLYRTHYGITPQKHREDVTT